MTWDTITATGESRLRGCIGSLSPTPLSQLADYTRKSAFNDRRFDPIENSEVQTLRVGVSLLVAYEEALHAFDWTIGVHGILIHFKDADGRSYNGTFLPEVAHEQGWTHEVTVRSLVRKAGFRGAESLTLEQLRGIRTTRYQSSKQKMAYEEYRAFRASEGRSSYSGVAGLPN